MQETRWRKSALSALAVFVLFVLVLSLGSAPISARSTLESYVFLFAFGDSRPPGWFDRPEDVAVDGTGHVYVVYRHRVQKFDSSDNTQFAYPGGVAADADSAVYVSSDSNKDYIVFLYTDRIQKFTGDGGFVTKWHGFDYPEGLTVDQEGRVCVADRRKDRIAVFGRSPAYEVYLPLVVRKASE